jgi:hypothetical protein
MYILPEGKASYLYLIFMSEILYVGVTRVFSGGGENTGAHTRRKINPMIREDDRNPIDMVIGLSREARPPSPPPPNPPPPNPSEL